MALDAAAQAAARAQGSALSLDAALVEALDA
jgi:hypothetical protein